MNTPTFYGVVRIVFRQRWGYHEATQMDILYNLLKRKTNYQNAAATPSTIYLFQNQQIKSYDILNENV